MWREETRGDRDGPGLVSINFVLPMTSRVAARLPLRHHRARHCIAPQNAHSPRLSPSRLRVLTIECPRYSAALSEMYNSLPLCVIIMMKPLSACNTK